MVRATPLGIVPSRSAKNEATERAKIKAIPLNWQVIPNNPDYPTDDLIVSAMSVTDPRLNPPLPRDPSQQDCTATFQAAIDQVWAQGGGTVFVPAGQYRFEGNLVVKSRVTLRGNWSRPAQSGWKTGTVLKVPMGKEDGDAFLSLNSDSAIKGLTFWHPDQKPNAPTPAAPTVAGAPTVTIEDVSFVNSWEALSIPKSSMLLLRGVYGTAIHRGLMAGRGNALPRFDSIYLSPSYWECWPLDTVHARADRNASGSFANLMWQNGIGFSLREMDGCTIINCNISGYSEGIVMEDNAGASSNEGEAPHGRAMLVNVTDCRTALNARIGYVRWTLCGFNGTEYGIRSSERGSVILDESSVTGGNRSVFSEPGSGFSLSALQSQFTGPIEMLGKGSLDCTLCSFTGRAPQVIAGKDISGTLNGCPQGSKVPEVQGGTLSVSANAPNLQRLPAFGLDRQKDWNRVRQPAKPQLFNVRDPRFAGGARGDGSNDDSDAVQAALRAATSNGGGIVFFPSGFYRLRGSFDLGNGVEFRGAGGSRFAAAGGMGDCTDQLMSVLCIEPNPGGLEGAPFLKLGDGSGVRNIMFFYPKQNWKSVLTDHQGFAPLPFAILAHGRGNYVIDCTSPNPDQFAHFQGAHDFLVEGCLLGGTRTVFRVSGGSEIGRIQNCHVKPSGFWGGLTDVPNSGENRELYGEEAVKQLVVFDLRDCSDITISAIFGRTAHRLLSAEGATGRALLVAGEQLQNGFVFEREGHGPFDLISCDSNLGLHGDETGKHAILLNPGFHGVIRAFSGDDGGTSDYVARVMGGQLISQDRGVPDYGYRSPRGVYVGGKGKLTLVNGSFDKVWTQTVEPGGILDAPTGQPPLVTAPGQLQFDEFGMKLDRSNTKRFKDTRSWSQILTNGNSFQIAVTAPAYTKGEVPNVELGAGLYTDAPCVINVYYRDAGGEKLARSVQAKDKELTSLKLKLRNARFTGTGNDLRIEIQGDLKKINPRLTYVTLR